MTLPPNGRRIIGSMLPPVDNGADGADAYEALYGDSVSVVDEAIQAQKLLPTDRSKWLRLMASDPRGTRDTLRQLTPVRMPITAGMDGDDTDDSAYAALFGSPGQRVTAAVPTAPPYEPDPYALNPLVDELAQTQPGVHRAATAEGPPPTLFESGDLPPFTASGIDPDLLMELPWTARHQAAATADAREALAIFEDAAGEPDWAAWKYGQHRGNQEYLARVRNWAIGRPELDRMTMPNQHTITAAGDGADDAYAALYGNTTG